jgi:hypothetical protein
MSDKMMTPKLRTGDTFKDVTDETIYIIADIGRIFTTNHYALVSMIDGRLYDNPVPNIENVFSDDEGDFVPVKIDVKSGLQSRKRVVEWGNPFVMHTDFRPIEGFECRQLADCEGSPTNIWQWGKYIDAPSQELNSEPYQNPIAGKEPELSRFLPDGAYWSNGVVRMPNKTSWGPNVLDECWNKAGLLSPKQGGGFQKHNPGDPMPCDGELSVDVMDTIGHIDCGDEADAWIWDYLDCQGDIVGWRPHYKEQN